MELQELPTRGPVLVIATGSDSERIRAASPRTRRDALAQLRSGGVLTVSLSPANPRGWRAAVLACRLAGASIVFEPSAGSVIRHRRLLEFASVKEAASYVRWKAGLAMPRQAPPVRLVPRLQRMTA